MFAKDSTSCCQHGVEPKKVWIVSCLISRIRFLASKSTVLALFQTFYWHLCCRLKLTTRKNQKVFILAPSVHNASSDDTDSSEIDMMSKDIFSSIAVVPLQNDLTRTRKRHDDGISQNSNYDNVGNGIGRLRHKSSNFSRPESTASKLATLKPKHPNYLCK